MEAETEYTLDQIISEISDLRSRIEYLLIEGTSVEESGYGFYDLWEIIDTIEEETIIYQRKSKQKTNKLKYFRQILVDESLWK